MSFGYYRSEILGALFSTLIIWILTGILVYMAVMRLITKDFEIEPIAMVVTASCGVFFNIVMYFVLHTNKLFNGINVHGHSHSDGSHGHGHSHAKPTTIPFPNGHGHSHSHNHSHNNNNNNNNNNTTNDHAHSHSINGKKTNNYKLEHISHSNNNLNNSEIHSANQSDQVQIPIENCSEPEIVQSNDDSSNINLRAAAIHVIGDFIQSVGVLVAALIIYFKVYLTYSYRYLL
jgi:solute carrier family 30 (zinc transporter), member 2